VRDVLMPRRNKPADPTNATASWQARPRVRDDCRRRQHERENEQRFKDSMH